MTVQGAWRAAALLFGIFAALAGFLFLRLKWTPRIDFDIIGFFWVLQNAGRLGALALFLVCAAAAVSFWIRAYWSAR